MAKAKSASTSSYVVVQEFRHENDFSKKHEVDTDVTHLPKEKLEHLERIGVVKKVTEEE